MEDLGFPPNDLCKVDALVDAHNLSHKSGRPAYAIETKFGWTISNNKPSLRYGMVVECYEGSELIA